MQGNKLVIFGLSLFKEKSANRSDSRKLDFDIQYYNFAVKKEKHLDTLLVKELMFLPETNSNETNMIQISYPSTPRLAHVVLPATKIYGFDKLKQHNNLYIPATISSIENIQVWAIRNSYETPDNYTHIAQLYAGNSGSWKILINKDINFTHFAHYEDIYFPSSIKQILYSLECEKDFDEVADLFDNMRLIDRIRFVDRYCKQENSEIIKKAYGNCYSYDTRAGKLLIKNYKILALLQPLNND